MDTDEILYTVSEAIRRSREIQDETQGRTHGTGIGMAKLAKDSLASSSGKAGVSAGVLDPDILREMYLSPSEALCAFLTITLHLKRAHGLPGPSSLDEMAQSVCNRVQSACGHFQKKHDKKNETEDHMLETVALQIAHWEKQRENAEKLEAKRKRRVETIFTLQEEITKTKLNTQDTLASNAVCAKVYDLMVNFTIEAADLHNFENRGLDLGAVKDELEEEERQREAEAKVRAEVRSALESVFPLYSVRTFCLDIYDNKVKQLGELCRLVVGILCFNAFTGKSNAFGDGKSLSPSKATLLASQRCAWHVVVLLKHLSMVNANAKKKWKRRQEDPAAVNALADLISLAEQSMCVAMESGLAWNALGCDSAENSDRTSQLLATLKSMVEGKQAVSKDTVYPLFDAIGRLYFEGLDFEFREQAMRESSFMRTLIEEDLGVTESDLAVFMQPPFVRRLKQAESSGGLEDHDLLDLDEESDNDLESQERDEVVKDAMQAWPSPLAKTKEDAAAERPYDLFEYGGYCPVSIVEDKVLRRGLPQCGVVVLEPSYSSQPKREEGDQGAEAGKPADRWFAFASKKCRTKFLKTPGKYTAQVTLECVTRLPQLIRLLKLSPDRATVDYACQLVNASEKSKEYGTQTQTHVVERRVDPNYCWNVWDLRKRGLQVRHAER